MAIKERPIIIDLGERGRSDIRDLKRGEGELAYEIDRVIDRVTQELGLGAHGRGGSVGATAGAGFSAGASVGTTSGAGAGIGVETNAGAGQPGILPVIVLYSKRRSRRRDEGFLSFMPMMDDDDDDDRDRD